MMEAKNYPHHNRTYQIIHAAQQGKYAVGGFCVHIPEPLVILNPKAHPLQSYNTDGVLATIRAAEKHSSPAVLQFFPWTMHHQGRHFIEFAASVAHAATVPISLHLDHCIKPGDADLALTMAFDSIMVDGSLYDEADNIAYVKRIVGKAREMGMTVEAELGRMEGGYKDVLEVAQGSGTFTEPDAAKKFVEETGVHFLAPSFGNVHGPYPEGGAEKCWQLERLKDIQEQVGEACPLVLHGTAISDDLLVNTVTEGYFAKVNQNKRVRRRYGEFLAESSGNLELTELQEKGVEIYAEEIGAMMLMLGSAGKA